MPSDLPWSPSFLDGVLIVAVILIILSASAYLFRVFTSITENIPKYDADILGEQAIAHDSINPRGFVFYQNRVYPARALDKYISQGQTVVIVAYEKEVLVVRPKTAMDERDTVE